MLFSCTKPGDEKRDPKQVGSEVTATFEQPVFDNATKALDNQFHFSFENNEQINIYPQALGQCMVCALTRTSDASRAKFHVNGFDLNYAQAKISDGEGVFAFKHVFSWLQINIDPNRSETINELVVSAEKV